MKKLAVLIFFFSLSNVLAQIKYEPGSITDTEGNKKQVLILNKAWRNNPLEIKFKTSETAEPETAHLRDVAAFTIGDYSKYVRFSAPIDHSSEDLDKMQEDPDPEFVEKTVFLEQLISGDINLYVYREGSLERFFYQKQDGPLTALIYKKYREGNRVGTNNSFRQQLYEEVSCGADPSGELRKVDYERKDLMKYFRQVLDCRNEGFQVFGEDGRKTKLNISAKAGLEFAKMRIEKGIYVSGNELKLDPGLHFGAELEVVLPFNRNKWSLFVEPLYMQYKIEKEPFLWNAKYNPHEVELSLNFEYISLSTGLKHYFFLNDLSKVHLMAGVGFDMELENSILIDRDDRYALDPALQDLKNPAYFNLGLGYTYRRLSGEIRYTTLRKKTGSYEEPTHYILNWQSNISAFSVLVGYRLF